MDFEQLKAFYAENFYYILAANIGIGLLLGAIPFILATRRGKRKLGLVAIIACGAVGVVSPVLSLIIAAVFIVLVTRQSGSVTPVRPDGAVSPESSE